MGPIATLAALVKGPKELVEALGKLAMLPANIADKYGDRSDRTWLRRFNVLLAERVMFTPDGISGALQTFCDDPPDRRRANWETVKSKLNDGQIVLGELNEMLAAKNDRFFSQHTDVLEIINHFKYNKGGRVHGTVADHLAMPTTPEEIASVRALIKTMNETNARIRTVRLAIEHYLKDAK